MLGTVGGSASGWRRAAKGVAMLAATGQRPAQLDSPLDAEPNANDSQSLAAAAACYLPRADMDPTSSGAVTGSDTAATWAVPPAVGRNLPDHHEKTPRKHSSLRRDHRISEANVRHQVRI